MILILVILQEICEVFTSYWNILHQNAPLILCQILDKHAVKSLFYAERTGFEPANRFCRLHAFQACYPPLITYWYLTRYENYNFYLQDFCEVLLFQRHLQHYFVPASYIRLVDTKVRIFLVDGTASDLWVIIVREDVFHNYAINRIEYIGCSPVNECHLVYLTHEYSASVRISCNNLAPISVNIWK